MSRDDFTPYDLEATLRDVFAHQAESVETPHIPFRAGDDSVAAIELTDELSQRRRSSRSRMFAAGASVLATAAAVILVIVSITPSTTHPQTPSEARVLAALNATTNKGSFVATYTIAEKPGRSRTATAGLCGKAAIAGSPPAVYRRGPVMTTPSAAPDCGYERTLGPKLTGTSTVSVDPVSILSTSHIDTISGDITVHADDTNVTDTNGVAPDTNTTTYKLTDFLSAANQTLGAREGSVSIMALASPTGYLTLTDDAARNAKPVGHSTVGGVNPTAVALYESTLTPAEMAEVPGTSKEESRAIHAALDALSPEGYTGTTMRIGVGFDGLVHSVTSTANFTDGGTVTLAATFSNFGCEAAASMRHQSVATACAPATTTTTVASTTSTQGHPVLSPPSVPPSTVATPTTSSATPPPTTAVSPPTTVPAVSPTT
jgi:hypothetical protein